MVWGFGQDASSWMIPWGGVSGMSIWEVTHGPMKDMLERLYLSAGLGKSWCPPRGVGGNKNETNFFNQNMDGDLTVVGGVDALISSLGKLYM